MKKSLLVILMMMATIVAVADSDGTFYFDEETEYIGRIYLNCLPQIQADFEEKYPGYLPEKYCALEVVKGGNTWDNCLCVSTCDEQRQLVYRPLSRGIELIGTTKSMGKRQQETNWQSIHKMGLWLSPDDMTLRYKPLWATPQKAKNIFTTSSDEKVANADSRDRMIFKPHVNPVRLSRQWQDGVGYRYQYKLTDPAAIKKMFRGYNDDEIAAIVVNHKFLESHTPLQYSRWKQGEPIRRLDKNDNSYVWEQINRRYHNRKVKSTQWLASMGEMTLWLIVFDQVRDNNALASIIVVKEGELESAYDDYAFLRPGGDRLSDGSPLHVWKVDDQGQYDLPEIMAIMHNTWDNTLEFYVRQPGSECQAYYILKEHGAWLVKISEHAEAFD